MKKNQRFLSFVLLCALLVNIMQYYLNNNDKVPAQAVVATEQQEEKALYLADAAAKYVQDIDGFVNEVQVVGNRLGVPAEWLMAVMHSESRFDASVANHKGSGATGLIQFMPATAKEHGITVGKLRNMNHIEQLEYVYRYLESKRRIYGNYNSVTELYLAILYPKALADKSDYCFALYMKPSKAYLLNSGLDENKDGSVTVLDIDKRMQRKYPTAYMTKIGQQVTKTQNAVVWTR